MYDIKVNLTDGILNHPSVDFGNTPPDIIPHPYSTDSCIAPHIQSKNICYCTSYASLKI